MNLRKRLEDKIAKKEKDIQDHEAAIKEGRAYIQAMQDTLKLLPRVPGGASGALTIRPDSQVGRVMRILKNSGKAMHIRDILKKLGKEATKSSRASVGGSLGAYVRRGEVFTRPAPGTFGLKEWEAKEEGDDVPDDFGVIDPEEEEELEG